MKDTALFFGFIAMVALIYCILAALFGYNPTTIKHFNAITAGISIIIIAIGGKILSMKD